MTPADWADPAARSIAVYLDGADDPDRAPDGTPLVDDDFLLLVNAWWDPLDFSIPPTREGQIWHRQLDTYEATDVPAGAEFATGETVTARSRSIVVLRGNGLRERSGPSSVVS